MKSLSTAEIRRTFLDYFKERGHAEVASSSLVPANDPTLLFTNAGMVQFKDVFTGKEKRSYSRATTSQKCVRAGGKHNDLENVGYTPRHHTFFEMLGNFSFGDYFKAEAIDFAWEFLTKVAEIPPHLLSVTIFRGEEGIPADDEAAEHWQRVGVPADRIFRLSKKDNYWQMAETGPQGPCTEIHFWTGEGAPNATLEAVEQSDGWIEIWNLVFMQFVKETADGPLDRLPKPCVDTGMGLERLSMVLQGKRSNYDIDLFQTILARIGELAGKKYGTYEDDDTSMRVIADHARATSFLIADGVQPSTGKREYVLRRIMRRAIRHGRRLGFDELFFHQACAGVVEAMGDAYPDLRRAAPLIEKVVQGEETLFRRTLDGGIKRVMQVIDDAKAANSNELAPQSVAKLYDTFGFPIDLTRVIASEHGMRVDEDAVQKVIDELQAASGQGGDISGEKAIDRIWFDVKAEVGPTKFLGYDLDDGEGFVKTIVVGGQRVDAAKKGDAVQLVLDQSPFYGESGGQVGDVGEIGSGHGRVRIKDTIKPLPDLIVHVGEVTEGEVVVGVPVWARVDSASRNQTRKNHSATHLLHLALKEVLGEHVQQKGSLVAPERLRFDYSHFERLTSEQVTKIERRVNEMVLANAPTATKLASLDDAKKEGAVMLFGEKYGDEVRMVRISDSMELCGGTHVARAGDIGLFKIVSDAPLASGIRRLEAVTGMNAVDWVQKRDAAMREAAAALRATPEDLGDRIWKLLERNKVLERDLEKAQTQLAMSGGARDEERPEEIGGIPVLFKTADGTPKNALRQIADQYRDKLGSGVVVLTAKEGDKATLLVAATRDITARVSAGTLVKVGSEAMGGKGGGKPDFAQGGGEAARLDDGLKAVREALRTL
jgi:alanyl-tRNA synthetase